mmetsp:Transcript_54305/g.151171  ORF Transcript_54305/g.151171 Transcript_54305/m.151171 type:complete len:279 (-) Transcript_54305:113-949(-)
MSKRSSEQSQPRVSLDGQRSKPRQRQPPDGTSGPHTKGTPLSDFKTMAIPWQTGSQLQEQPPAPLATSSRNVQSQRGWLDMQDERFTGTMHDQPSGPGVLMSSWLMNGRASPTALQTAEPSSSCRVMSPRAPTDLFQSPARAVVATFAAQSKAPFLELLCSLSSKRAGPSPATERKTWGIKRRVAPECGCKRSWLIFGGRSSVRSIVLNGGRSPPLNEMLRPRASPSARASAPNTQMQSLICSVLVASNMCAHSRPRLTSDAGTSARPNVCANGTPAP